MYDKRSVCVKYHSQGVQTSFYESTVSLRSHPTGSSTLEAPTTTFSLFRSDKPVFTTTAFRPSSPCHPTQAMAGPVVSHIRNPYPTFPGGVLHFQRRLDPGLGRPHGDSQIAGVRTRSERELHISVLELREDISVLHHWVTVLQGHHVLIATDKTTCASTNRVGPIPTPCCGW